MGSEACYLLIHRPLLSVGCAGCARRKAELRGPSRCSWGCAPGRQMTSLKQGAAFAASTVRRARGSLRCDASPLRFRAGVVEGSLAFG